METRTLLKMTATYLLLAVLLLLLYLVGSMQPAFTALSANLTPEELQLSLPMAAAIALIDSALLCWLILRSRASGWRLMLLVAVTYYGVKTLLSQIEAWYFLPELRGEFTTAVLLATLPVALLWPPVAVWALGKARPFNAAAIAPRSLAMPWWGWAWRLALLALLVYPLLFFSFGYFVAWQNPDVRALYNGTIESTFLAQMVSNLRADPLVYPYEVLRALIWIALALPIYHLHKGPLWETALLVGLLFALLMNDSHFIPSPIMEASVRWSHFWETALSNLIWGMAIVVVFGWRSAPAARTTTGRPLPV